MSRRKKSIPCVHGLVYAYCKTCKREYDAKQSAIKQELYYQKIEAIGCEACKFSHRYALEFHHFAQEYKRYGRSQSMSANLEDWVNDKGLYLCGNCHNIFHGIFGGKVKEFPILDKNSTVQLIMNERNPK